MLSSLKQVSIFVPHKDSHWKTELIVRYRECCHWQLLKRAILHIFPSQVTSHNKERRSKRDEKLDKKSQAMEELKAEREKRKNRTGQWGKCSIYFVSVIIGFDFLMPIYVFPPFISFFFFLSSWLWEISNTYREWYNEPPWTHHWASTINS